METAPPPVVLLRNRVLHDVILHEVARIDSRRQRRQRLDNHTFAAVTTGSAGVLLVALMAAAAAAAAGQQLELFWTDHTRVK